MAKSMKVGAGGQFQKLTGELAKKPGITNPGALAAKIGREKLGKANFQKIAARGKERATAERKGEKKPPLLKVPAKKAGSGLAEGLTRAAASVKK